MPQLRILLGHQQGQVYSLESRPFCIGREPNSDVVLEPDSPASRRHAVILCEAGEWVIRDLESRNGTELNGVRVKIGTLNHNDEILVGDGLFLFEYCDQGTAQTAAAASRAVPSESKGLQNDPAMHEFVVSMAEKTMKMERETARLLGSQSRMVREIFTAILAGGHCMIIGLPESVKASIVKALGSLFGLTASRVTLTSSTEFLDVIQMGGGEPGPLFSELVMMEGMQHAPQSVQAVILEAMTHGRMRINGESHVLADPFCVLSMHDSAAVEGSALLRKEAREEFMFCLVAGPSEAAAAMDFENLMTAAQVSSLRALVRDFSLNEALVDQAVRIVCATRPATKEAPTSVKRCVASGAGPGAARALLLAAKAHAVLAGRMAATEDDLRAVALPVLRHRITLNAAAAAEGTDEERVVRKVLLAVLGN